MRPSMDGPAGAVPAALADRPLALQLLFHLLSCWSFWATILWSSFSFVFERKSVPLRIAESHP